MKKSDRIATYVAALLKNPSFLLMVANQSEPATPGQQSIQRSGDTLVPNISPATLAKAVGRLEGLLNNELVSDTYN